MFRKGMLKLTLSGGTERAEKPLIEIRRLIIFLKGLMDR